MRGKDIRIALAGGLLCGALALLLLPVVLGYWKDIAGYLSGYEATVKVQDVTVTENKVWLEHVYQDQWEVELLVLEEGKAARLAKSYLGSSKENLKELEVIRSSRGKDLNLWLTKDSRHGFQLERSFPTSRLWPLILYAAMLGGCIFGTVASLKASKKSTM